MNELWQNIKHYLDPNTIATAGYFVLIFVVFAETGLAAGFFLPGDSLLFVAGLFAADGKFNLFILLFTVFAAAVIGGCSLRGGEGSIVGIILGAAVLQVIRNLVNLMDIPSSLDFAVMGAVILVGAIADELVRSRSTNRESE